MPDFPNPFSGNVDRKVNKEELVQALRVDIAGELEAMFLYDAHAQATDDPLVRKVLMDIRGGGGGPRGHGGTRHRTLQAGCRSRVDRRQPHREVAADPKEKEA